MNRMRGTMDAAASAVFASTAGRLRQLDRADGVIRAPLALSHRVAFVQLRGGTGTSAVAAYVASLLAHRRRGPVLAVNASAGERTILWYAGLDGIHFDSIAAPTGPGRAIDARRSRPQGFADAAAGLDRTAGGLYALDVRPELQQIAATEFDWAGPVSAITRFYDVVCTDWGVRRAELDLGGVAAGSHAVCIVTRDDRSSLEEAVAVSTALSQVANHPRVVIAAIDLADNAGRAARAVRWTTSPNIVNIPWDAARESASPVSSGMLSTRSRLAGTKLTAELMQQTKPGHTRASS